MSWVAYTRQCSKDFILPCFQEHHEENKPKNMILNSMELFMFSNLWSLALICSIGSICTVLRTILKIPATFQVGLLLTGFIICYARFWGLIKLLLGKHTE